MKVSGEGFQPTDLSPTPGATPAPVKGRATKRGAAPTAAPARRRGATRGKPTFPRQVGVVFVHGIGNQRPAETFLDWSSSIVRMLSAWRVEQGFGVDPVVRSQFAFDPGALPFLELDIPAHGGREAARWIVTEALWAEAIRAPSLGAAGAYLRDRLLTIVAGIQDGYRVREPEWEARRRADVAAAAPAAEPWLRARLAELDGSGWGWIPAVDALQRSFLTQSLVVLPIVALGSLLLTLWAPLRRIPLGPLRDFAEARIVDSFLTDWFGDLPVLLDDPVQAANVRARVAETVAALEARGCDSIVLIAHSGGAIVSFETLLDGAYLPRAERGVNVDKLVTHGEGLRLGWRLEDAYNSGLERGHRLAGNIATDRPDLRWIDVWASFDPAPAGPLKPVPAQVELDIGDTGAHAQTSRETGTGRLLVESRPVTNLMSLRNDHGGYWDNDEGYLIPLLRHIDDSRGWGEGSRFYGVRELRTVRIERRRQRVAVLAAWRWLAGLAAAIAVFGGGIAAGAPRIAGDTFIGIWARVPGGELLAGPVGAVWGAFGTLLSLFGRKGLADSLPSVGPVLVGGVVIGLLFLAVALIGSSAWTRWDATERAAARLERLPPLDRRFAVAGAATALASLVTIDAAALVAGSGSRVALILATGTVLGLALSTLLIALMPGKPDAES